MRQIVIFSLNSFFAYLLYIYVGVTTRGMARKTNESPQNSSSPNNKDSDPSQIDITSPGTSKGTTFPNKRSLNSEPSQHSTCSKQTKVKQTGKKMKNMWSDSDADKCTCGKMLNRLAMDTDESMAKFVQEILKGDKTGEIITYFVDSSFTLLELIVLPVNQTFKCTLNLYEIICTLKCISN